jgi:Cu2+-exporting ATPase
MTRSGIARAAWSESPVATAQPPEPEAVCFHCGEPVPPRTHFDVVVGGAPRRMCCAGCSAVARAIIENGLEDYYERRERFAPSRREAVPGALSELRVFDREEIQRKFATGIAPHEQEVALIFEGIHCPACVWLNEAHLARQRGVTGFHINYTTRRATLRWDSGETRLSDLLAAIGAIGYRAYPYDPGAMEASRNRERRDALLRFAVAGLGMMQVMMYAIPAYLAGQADISADASALMRWASLILTSPVVLYAAAPFFRGALRDLKQRRVGMDVPVAIGIGAAFGASVAATLAGHGEVYFDSVAMFVFFLLGARYLEMRARQRAAAYLEFLARATPAVAQRFTGVAPSLETETVPAGLLLAGDRVLVCPGERFPADGRIEDGETDADEALLTGESRPIAKRRGDEVIGGSVNLANAVTVIIERIGADTLLAGVVRLMERGLRERPPIQQLADRIAGAFVAIVLEIAAVAALYWGWAEPARALPVAVAVLVVSCPCALSLATPMALAVATAAMARVGIVVTRAPAIETLARATHFVFDKTGTLTEGRLRVLDVRPLGNAKRPDILRLAAALERSSEHPLARAIAAAAPPATVLATNVRNFPGQGVEGIVEGRRVRIGHKEFVAELCRSTVGLERSATHATTIWLGDESGSLAQFTLEDRVRTDARALVSSLRKAGRFVMLFSGDEAQAVRAAAAGAGISYARARMLPDEKAAAVRQMQEQGAVVAMIGDGVNDAPVLAQAQVSIAMGAGAALAHGAADMVLMSPMLSDLGRGVRLSRKTLRIVRQNLTWAFAYNLIALPLAVSGMLTPWMAGIGMSASSLFVVLNALRASHTGMRRLGDQSGDSAIGRLGD